MKKTNIKDLPLGENNISIIEIGDTNIDGTNEKNLYMELIINGIIYKIKNKSAECLSHLRTGDFCKIKVKLYANGSCGKLYFLG